MNAVAVKNQYFNFKSFIKSERFICNVNVVEIKLKNFLNNKAANRKIRNIYWLGLLILFIRIQVKLGTYIFNSKISL